MVEIMLSVTGNWGPSGAIPLFQQVEQLWLREKESLD